ncbi:MAG: hypothetical protein M3235_02120 [Actinomycetota bacterium]|nr:hypothetical protein [Actinomycetota bacterium]
MTAPDLAQDWLGAFDRTLAAGDQHAVAALFQPDGYWRDVLAFTWHLRTYTGTDEIAAAFAATLHEVKPHSISSGTSTPPRAAPASTPSRCCSTSPSATAGGAASSGSSCTATAPP